MPEKTTRPPSLRRTIPSYDTEDDVTDEVYTTVVREVAHHFGIDDDRLDELGWC